MLEKLLVLWFGNKLRLVLRMFCFVALIVVQRRVSQRHWVTQICGSEGMYMYYWYDAYEISKSVRFYFEPESADFFILKNRNLPFGFFKLSAKLFKLSASSSKDCQP